MTIVLIIIFAIQVICGMIVQKIAKNKGLKEIPWTVWGFSLGPIALILVLLAPNKKSTDD